VVPVRDRERVRRLHDDHIVPPTAGTIGPLLCTNRIGSLRTGTPLGGRCVARVYGALRKSPPSGMLHLASQRDEWRIVRGHFGMLALGGTVAEGFCQTTGPRARARSVTSGRATQSMRCLVIEGRASLCAFARGTAEGARYLRSHKARAALLFFRLRRSAICPAAGRRPLAGHRYGANPQRCSAAVE
jgi:hypothetical protein